MAAALTPTGAGPGGSPQDEYLRVQFAGDSEAAGRARRAMGRLRAELDPPLMESARLLITELVTNSVRHAHAPTIEMAVAVSKRDVHVEIANPGGGFEPRPSGPDDTEKGWGLFLVDRLADQWGVDDSAGGYQRVWFELARA
jgi:anti-sigma regulatory factor (Ser/Thr protein kinase)